MSVELECASLLSFALGIFLLVCSVHVIEWPHLVKAEICQSIGALSSNAAGCKNLIFWAIIFFFYISSSGVYQRLSSICFFNFLCEVVDAEYLISLSVLLALACRCDVFIETVIRGCTVLVFIFSRLIPIGVFSCFVFGDLIKFDVTSMASLSYVESSYLQVCGDVFSLWNICFSV